MSSMTWKARPSAWPKSVSARSCFGDAFAKDLVIRGPAAAKIVVVHAWQIVVNERVSVDALDCAGVRQRVVERSGARLGGGEREHGAQTFSTGEEAVSHGRVDRRGF